MNATFDREEFLNQVQVGVLATVDRRGRPHAIPMWCLYENGEFIMSTGPKSQKARNIEHNGRAVLVFDRRDLPYYAVMIHGTAELVPAQSADTIRRIAEAYLGEDGAREYMGRRGGGDTLIIRFKPEKFIEYRGISGRN